MVKILVQSFKRVNCAFYGFSSCFLGRGGLNLKDDGKIIDYCIFRKYPLAEPRQSF